MRGLDPTKLCYLSAMQDNADGSMSFEVISFHDTLKEATRDAKENHESYEGEYYIYKCIPVARYPSAGVIADEVMKVVANEAEKHDN